MCADTGACSQPHHSASAPQGHRTSSCSEITPVTPAELCPPPKVGPTALSILPRIHTHIQLSMEHFPCIIPARETPPASPGSLREGPGSGGAANAPSQEREEAGKQAGSTQKPVSPYAFVDIVLKGALRLTRKSKTL